MFVILCEIILLLFTFGIIKAVLMVPKTWLTIAVIVCAVLICIAGTSVFAMDLPALIRGGDEKLVKVEYVTEKAGKAHTFTVVTSDGITYWGIGDITLELDNIRGKNISLYVLPTSRFIYKIPKEMQTEWAYSSGIDSATFYAGFIIVFMIVFWIRMRNKVK